MSKRRVCIDFDGVVHSYQGGWMDGSIYGHPVPGFFAWALQAKECFELNIYSSRSKTAVGREAMRSWLADHLEEYDVQGLSITDFVFPEGKPAASVYIDDRALPFRGDWSAPELQPSAIAAFKSWVQA
jgi:hypothetical protein